MAGQAGGKNGPGAKSGNTGSSSSKAVQLLTVNIHSEQPESKEELAAWVLAYLYVLKYNDVIDIIKVRYTT
ncbi:uncharacterized protein E0L32_009022 [Thyridium curvatum]|uniref:Uncharacterized protein n=1 Tax=Thyridium curvatum TaxID=1093900 RepID=A0A507AY90_9PEZI|nr:uncharacterized protein E0L32_009022 [Thyridium curvatum]TPX09831.1 hypothetical protein E0L32_009022 [Thyridium curvatum]